MSKILPKTHFLNTGFSLIEVLVTITIIGILAAIAIPNFRRFNEEQILKNESAKVMQTLRQTQSNSQSRVRCVNTSASLTWFFKVNSTNSYSYFYTCEGELTPGDVVTLSSLPEGLIFEAIRTNNPSCTDMSAVNFITNFINKGNRVTFESPTTCLQQESITSIKLVLKNTRLNSSKNIIIDKGGAIYVE